MASASAGSGRIQRPPSLGWRIGVRSFNPYSILLYLYLIILSLGVAFEVDAWRQPHLGRQATRSGPRLAVGQICSGAYASHATFPRINLTSWAFKLLNAQEASTVMI